MNTPHVRVPRAAIDLCNNAAEKGAVLDLYAWADDNRYRARKMTASDLQARWGMSARKCEGLLRELIAEGLVLLAISDHIGASGAPVWPSVSRIASPVRDRARMILSRIDRKPAGGAR